MKLISCYIQNYGALSNLEINFESLTEFYGKNGEGKTTLASYIKAMFYGLPKATKYNREREHYFPWNGNYFGGNLIFEHNDKEYRIERRFDKKGKDDECLVFINNVIVNDFNGKIIGQEIFGLDEDSFKRTLFFNNNDLTFNDDDISMKLYGFVFNSDEKTLEDAVKILEETRKKYKPLKGNNGFINILKDENQKISQEIGNYKNIADNLPNKENKLDELNTEKKALNETLSKIRKQKELKHKYEELNKYENDKKEEEEKLISIKNKYDLIPAVDESKHIKNIDDELKKLNAKYESKFSKNDELSRLKTKFLDGTPSEQEISNVQSKIEECSKLINRNNLINNNLSEDDLRLIDKFKSINIEEINNTKAKIKKAENKDFNGENKDKKTSSKNKIMGIISLILAFVSLGLGIALYFIINTKLYAISICSFCLTIFTIVGLILLLKNNKTKDFNNDEIYELLKKYGYYSKEEKTEISLVLFKKDLETYEMTINKQAENKQEENKNKEEILNIKGSLNDFFNKYQTNGETYEIKLHQLKEDLNNYRRLSNEYNEFILAKEKEENKIKEDQKIILDFKIKYKIESDLNQFLDQLNIDNDIKIDLETRIKDIDFKITSLKKENNLVDNPTFEDFDDEESLLDRFDKLVKESTTLEQEIKDNQNDADKIPELIQRYYSNLDQIKVYENKVRLINETIFYLKESDKNLKEKYLKPLVDSFKKYSKLIEKDMEENIVLNQNYEISYENNGQLHDSIHLSEGLKTICALCLRLALIDNMFKDEKPFVIFDDPLQTLDEKHLETSKKLIIDLSKEIQIVYFTCHESRNLKIKSAKIN